MMRALNSPYSDAESMYFEEVVSEFTPTMKVQMPARAVRAQPVRTAGSTENMVMPSGPAEPTAEYWKAAVVGNAAALTDAYRSTRPKNGLTLTNTVLKGIGTSTEKYVMPPAAVRMLGVPSAIGVEDCSARSAGTADMPSAATLRATCK